MVSWSSIELWGLLFLLTVFIEDFYLYHKEVAPFLKEGAPSPKSLVLEVAIVFSWFLSQTSFSKKQGAFAFFLAVFYLLKIIGGVKMTDRLYPARRDTAFVVPILGSVICLLLKLSADTSLAVMLISCLASSTLWWFVLPRTESPD